MERPSIFVEVYGTREQTMLYVCLVCR